MDRTQALALRNKILERRNYLKDVDVSLTTSKRSLYGGMQERLRRREDVSFKKNIEKQKKHFEQRFNMVNTYINRLSARDAYRAEIRRRELLRSQSEDPDSLVFQQIVAPIIPAAPKATLASAPKRRMVRRAKRSIGKRRRD